LTESVTFSFQRHDCTLFSSPSHQLFGRLLEHRNWRPRYQRSTSHRLLHTLIQLRLSTSPNDFLLGPRQPSLRSEHLTLYGMAAAMGVPPPAAEDGLTEGSKHTSNEHNIHTPPASDMSSHGRKGDDDDAASSSELSDLDEQFEGAPQPPFTQDVPMLDAPAIVEPHRYEGGIPVFQPVCPNGDVSFPLVPLQHDCRLSTTGFNGPCANYPSLRPWTNFRTSRNT
jgi:hypothetical protein